MLFHLNKKYGGRRLESSVLESYLIHCNTQHAMWLLSHRGADSASLFYYLFLAVLVCVHNVTAALRFNISPRHKLRFLYIFLLCQSAPTFPAAFPRW